MKKGQTSFNDSMEFWGPPKMILLTALLNGVWCRDFNISLPGRTDALRGSCVIINCGFDINNTYDRYLNDSALGVWYKDGHQASNLVFNSSSPINTFKGNITGKLKNKNCTTIFYNVSLNHNGTFFFKIDGGLKWTYAERSALIVVNESPPKPTVQMFKDQMEVEGHEEVLEGSSMCLRCSAKTLCSSSPPTLTWSSTDRLHLNESSRLQLDQQKQTEIISDLNFTATHLQHGVTFICTITYQLQQRNTTAQSNITLRVQYAPKVSFSSSCTHRDVTEYLCKAHGNPFPKVEWRLSGRPVSNSTNTSISEERLSGTDLSSFITLHQSLTHTDTLQCVIINTHGTASQQIQLVLLVKEGNHPYSFLLGVAGGASVMMLLWLILLCPRKKHKSSKTRQEDTLSVRENEEESVYVSEGMLSPYGATIPSNQESLHYSSIDFTNNETESGEIRGISSLTTDYAVVRHYSAPCSSDPQSNSNTSPDVMDS
ncbi:myelin-associated glycoprotein-like isoform X2 [Paramisgurnus dabryanus]|uniref:myelin-associated glycoprotein-like isoform X2 n=1 Tax=Paramisgurnus dabryanus TaxID=90735 RepID=UPI003CCFCB1C